MPASGASSAHDSTPLRVGYILKMFPRLSETFILHEILELERQGVDVSVFSLMLPDDGRFHGRLSALKLTVRNVPRDKPETLWEMAQALPPELAPSSASRNDCEAFLRRHGIPGSLELLLRAVLVAAEVKSRGIQHLHAHFATIAARMAFMVHKMTGVPFSFTSHAKDIFRATVDRELYKELVDEAAFNITVSDYNRAYILEHTPGIDAQKILRLYNGIDLEFFRSARTEPDGRDARVPHVVSVGRLVEKKGFHVLLEALALWQRRGMKFRATIIGDGENRAALQRQHAALALGDSVRFAGALPQEEVLRICCESTMMVLACMADEIGNQDALPTTLLEALALGVPAVSTTLAGIPEIVRPECGLLCPPGEAAPLAEAMTTLLDRIRRGDVSAAHARERAEQLFDLRKNVATLRSHFQTSARGR